MLMVLIIFLTYFKDNFKGNITNLIIFINTYNIRYTWFLFELVIDLIDFLVNLMIELFNMTINY